MRLEPRPSTWDSTSSRAPLPTATRITTAATPMTTPNMVSPLRSRLARSASSATRNASANLTPPLSAALRAGDGRAAGNGCAVGLDQPVAHPQLPTRPGGDLVVVGDEHDGDPALGVEPFQDGHDLGAGAGVEVAGRLVGEQQRRVADERAGDGDPLLLTAGHLRGSMTEAMAQPDRLKRRDRALLAFGPADSAVDQGQRDVVHGAGARQQLEGLEDEADGLVAQLGQFTVAERVRRPGR